MNYPKRASYCENLVVVNFWSKHLDERLRAWNEKSTVGYAETCNRQVWFGLEKDFRDFPMPEGHAIKRRNGRDAYEFLLQLACGLDSNRIGEDRVKGEIFRNWDRYLDAQGKEKKKLAQIMDAIKADSRFVAETLADMKQFRHEIAARDLSGMRPGDKIHVIADIDGREELSRTSDGIMRVTGNERKTRVDTIAITNPDPEKLTAAYAAAVALKDKAIITANIERTPFENLTLAFEKADRVYVDLAMGKHLAAEEEILYAWQGRVRRDNTLTSLRGSPEKMNMSIPLWEEAGLDNYVSPENIRAEMGLRHDHNSRVVEKAKQAIVYCADLRDAGIQPSHSKVRSYLRNLDAPVAAVA